MTFDFKHIIESKRAQSRNLASRPIAEKLRMLDALRERELDIRGRSGSTDSARGIVHEESSASRTKPE